MYIEKIYIYIHIYVYDKHICTDVHDFLYGEYVCVVLCVCVCVYTIANAIVGDGKSKICGVGQWAGNSGKS